MPQFEPKQFGKYFLLEKLAVGGMAEIYKAKTYGVDGFEKLLVLKRILPHCSADRDFITMLVDEAKLSVALSHANIVQVYDLGKVGQDYFISMEYINGINLRDIMYKCREQNIKIPEEIAVYIVSEVCKGLDYAHRKTNPSGEPLNIVHRDVSPQNVLLSYEGEVKIVDFGIAKAAMNISHTMAGILKGKIAYMSPEQALGKTVDYRTDIFSAGIILYETLTGEKLFTGESQFEVLKKIRSTKIDPAKLPESVPAELKNIMAKALAYHAKDRYSLAGDMQIELTRYLYTSHVDFTPHKLAAFIKELFAEDIAKQHEKGALEAVLEAQTSSINVAEEALQENIVHRDETAPTIPIKKPLEGEISLTGKEATEPTSRKRRFGKNLYYAGLAGLGILGIALAYFKFVEPRLENDKKEALVSFGTVNISSNPEGAAIIIDEKDTGLTTPAVIEKLELNIEHSLKLSKKGFEGVSQTFTLPSTTPVSISLTMAGALGVLEIDSDPKGASIMIDGEPSGEETPATLSGITLNEDFKVTLTKQGYKNFEQKIALTSSEPQKISPKLEQAAAFGTLAVKSSPAGAQIFLNGRDTGLVTPSVIKDVPVGEEQNIKLSKPDFETVTKTAMLKDIGELEVLAELKPVKGTPPAAPTPAPATKPVVQKPLPAKQPAPAQKVAPQPTPQPAPIAKAEPQYASTSAPASLKVASDPSGAEVFIDGEYKGTTPVAVSGIRPGSISLLINKEGKARSSQKISLQPGEAKDLGTVKLGELYGSVSIVTNPSRADIFFDGENIGAKSPVTVKKVRRDKSHSLKVVLKGYKVWESAFDMEGGNEKKFNITLEKE